MIKKTMREENLIFYGMPKKNFLIKYVKIVSEFLEMSKKEGVV